MEIFSQCQSKHKAQHYSKRTHNTITTYSHGVVVVLVVVWDESRCDLMGRKIIALLITFIVLKYAACRTGRYFV